MLKPCAKGPEGDFTMNNTAQTLALRREELLRRAAQQRLNLQWALAGRSNPPSGASLEKLSQPWRLWLKPLLFVLAPVTLFLLFQRPAHFFKAAHRIYPVWKIWMIWRSRFFV